MKRLSRNLFPLSLALIVLAVGEQNSASAADKWGTLKGQFVYDGDTPEPEKLKIDKDVEEFGSLNLVDESLVVGKDGGLGNVIIYLRTKPSAIHPDYEGEKGKAIKFDNKGGKFVPHILTVWLDNSLDITNSDKVGHNSNVQPIGDTGTNPLIPPGGSAMHKFRREQKLPVEVKCNIHGWMRGYVLPRGNPYMAVSAEDGTFEIKNMPVGEQEFQVWHERRGYLSPKSDWKKGVFKMKIEEGDNDLGVIKVDPKLVEKKS